MITLNQLIKMQVDIPSDMIIEGKKRNTKIMFHKIDLKRIEINPHYNLVGFEFFQKEHHNNFFANTDYILSFWYEGKVAEFIGTYKLHKPIIDTIIDAKTQKKRERYRFPEMIKRNFLKDYEQRLIIKWTNPTANYGRWIDESKYEIYAIKQGKENSIGKIPRNYYEISLNYQELKKMFEYPIDNFEWKDYLSNRSGVYVILDKISGQQYIGSAYGKVGFWGRWKDYATTGDGGNEGLKGKDFNKFNFSILFETLNTIDEEKIIGIESKFKANLGTKIFGLNNN